MARPGTTITRSETRPARSARTGTGPWFIAGITGTADTDAAGPRKPVVSLSEYAARFGARAAHTDAAMYDAAEWYFKEGGSELFVSPTADALDPALDAALALFTKDLGPGQVSAPARTTVTQRLALANHARDNNRIAVLATTDTDNVATLTAEADVAGISTEAERYAGLFGPWLVVPIGAGMTRTISPEAVVAGIMSRNDGDGISPNQPAAGILGVSGASLDVSQAFSDADRVTLNANGVNIIRSMYDGVRVYGYRTLADEAADPLWINLGNARLFMAIQAEADAIAERFVFRQLDGQRHTVNEYGGVLSGMLLPYWERGSLYGMTASEAFRVDVSPNVNSDEDLADGRLRAILALKTSPFAEEVILELVKTRITEAI